MSLAAFRDARRRELGLSFAGFPSRMRASGAQATDQAVAYWCRGDRLPGLVFAHPHVGDWLADGFHRVASAELAGAGDLPADIRPGGRRAALRFALGANAAHGLPRTREDKQRA